MEISINFRNKCDILLVATKLSIVGGNHFLQIGLLILVSPY